MITHCNNPTEILKISFLTGKLELHLLFGDQQFEPTCAGNTSCDTDPPLQARAPLNFPVCVSDIANCLCNGLCQHSRQLIAYIPPMSDV